MQKIMIFYHSGAGATRIIGEILQEKLADDFEVDLHRVDMNYDYATMQEYDFFIFGFPVFGFEASPSMQEFIMKMPKIDKAKKCLIYATLGFLSGNSIRKLAMSIEQKNLIPIGYEQILSPGSDAALMFPASWKWPRSFKRKSADKIADIIQQSKKGINAGDYIMKMPPQKFFWTKFEKMLMPSILKQEKRFINGLRIVEEKCTNCNKCITVCKRGCISKGDMHPFMQTTNCEFCLGCVHHCPAKAITFQKQAIDKPRLDKQFFERQKEILLNDPALRR